MPEIEQEWLRWMREEHIPEVLATQQFQSASLLSLQEPVDDDGLTFIAQYKTDQEEKYQHYLEHFAPALREKGLEKFGNQFIAFRTFLKMLE